MNTQPYTNVLNRYTNNNENNNDNKDNHINSNHTNYISEVTNTELNSQFLIAVRDSDWETVQHLVLSGADVNAQDPTDGTSALMWVVKNNCCDYIKYLLDYQVDLNLQDINGNTALSLAIRLWNYSVVEELLLAKADPNLADFDGDSPLIVCIKRGYKDILALLMCDDRLHINCYDKLNETALIHACRNGYEDIVDSLLAKHVVINMRSNRNESALSLSIANGYSSIALKLLEAGSEISIINDYKDTTLILATRTGNTVVVYAILQLMVERNCQYLISLQDQHGREAICHAVKSGFSDIVELLLLFGANVNAKDAGTSNLAIAATEGYELIVELLLQAGANIYDVDKRESSALILAAASGHIGIVNMLLHANANVNARNINGRTALHKAANRGFYDIVLLLIRANANVNALDNDHITPIMFAATNCHVDIVQLLIGAGTNLDNDQYPVYNYLVEDLKSKLQKCKAFVDVSQTTRNQDQSNSANLFNHISGKSLNDIIIQNQYLLNILNLEMNWYRRKSLLTFNWLYQYWNVNTSTCNSVNNSSNMKVGESVTNTTSNSNHFQCRSIVANLSASNNSTTKRVKIISPIIDRVLDDEHLVRIIAKYV